MLLRISVVYDDVIVDVIDDVIVDVIGDVIVDRPIVQAAGAATVAVEL